MGNLCANGGGVKRNPTPESKPSSQSKAAEELPLDKANPVDQLQLASTADIHEFYILDDKVLGRGQYGEVRKATHKKTKGEYVVKTILKKKVRRPEIMKRENEFLLRATHPNICNVVDIFEGPQHMFIVQDYCRGGEMFDEIVDRYGNGKNFTEHDVCLIAQQLLNGVAYCHDTLGICHRDLKPENIMFREKGSLDIVIIDFGLSASIEFKDGKKDLAFHDHMSTKVGTPYYMAPEVMSGDYGRECDLWSIGVITYVLMCGYPPFGGNNQNAIMANVRNKRNNVEFHNDERWGTGRVSNESKDFIRSLLDRDVKARPTAKSALLHPWFKKTRTDDLPLAQTIGPSLQRFHDMSQLKRMASMAVAHQVVDSPEVKELRKIFNSIDVNNDKTIHVTELKDALKGWPPNSFVKLDSLFESLDVEGTGVIGLDEFLAATVPPTLALQDENIQKAFDEFDTDKSGFITLENLKEVCSGDEDELKMLINDGDFYNDGKISFDEFKHMMKMPEHKTMLSREKSGKDETLINDIANLVGDPNHYNSTSVRMTKSGDLPIGIRITQAQISTGGVLFIVQDPVAEKSIANSAGLQSWDVIDSIDGIAVADLDLSSLKSTLRKKIKTDGGCALGVLRIDEVELTEALNESTRRKSAKGIKSGKRPSSHVTFSLSKHM